MLSSAAASAPQPGDNERSFASAAQAIVGAKGLVESLRARASDVDPIAGFQTRASRISTTPASSAFSAPRMFGGSQLGISPLVQCVAAVASGCGSTGWVYAVLSGHNWAVGLFPDEEHSAKFFSDPDALVASIVRLGGNAPKKVDGGYLFENAAGKFCSRIEHAKWIMVGAGVANGSGARSRAIF